MAKIKRICSVEGCGKPHRTKGFCSFHYQRFHDYGDPLHEMQRPATDFFWAVVNSGEQPDECVIWPFSRDRKGYGIINYKGKTQRAHRIICQLVHGEPPSPIHQAAHECGNGHLGCINPKHVSWKTPKENMADQRVHGTLLEGSRKPMAKLTEDNVRDIRNAVQGGASMAGQARLYGVSPSSIYNVVRRVRWRQVA